MNYRFHRAALAEHLDEVAFYESRLPGLGRGLPCRIREDHGARLRHARLLPKGRRFRPPQSRAQAFPVSRHLSGEICADPCPRHRTSAPPTGLLGGKNWEMKVAKVRKLEQTIAASGAGILEP